MYIFIYIDLSRWVCNIHQLAILLFLRPQDRHTIIYHSTILYGRVGRDGQCRLDGETAPSGAAGQSGGGNQRCGGASGNSQGRPI